MLYGGVCIDWKKLFQPDTVQGRAGQSKLYFWDENKLRSDIAAEYAYKALVSVAEMSKQYNTIIELLNNIAISEHGNTHEQTE